MKLILDLIHKINTTEELIYLYPVGFILTLHYIARKYFWDGPGDVEEEN